VHILVWNARFVFVNVAACEIATWSLPRMPF